MFDICAHRLFIGHDVVVRLTGQFPTAGPHGLVGNPIRIAGHETLPRGRDARPENTELVSPILPQRRPFIPR